MAQNNPKYTDVTSVEVQMRQDDFKASQTASLGYKNLSGGAPEEADAKPVPEVRYDTE